MPPPFINDDAPLLEIAVIAIREPHLKFASIYRKAIQKVPAYRHSDDSCRRRLHRKFKNDQDYWLKRGHAEIHARQEAQVERFQTQLEKRAALAAKRTKSAFEVLQEKARASERIFQSSGINQLMSRIQKQQEQYDRIFKASQFEQTMERFRQQQEQFARIFEASELEKRLAKFQESQEQARKYMEAIAAPKIGLL